MKRSLAFAASALALIACHAEYNVVLLPTTKEEPHDPCAFEVTDTFPRASDVAEIGRLEVEFWPSHDLASFKDAIQGDVCRIGADTVVAEVKDGRINEAILYRATTKAAP